jgi:hypothetical protein
VRRDAGAALERLHHPTGERQRRHGAEEHSGEHRHRKGEQQHRCIDRNLRRARREPGGERNEQVDADEGEPDAERRAHQGQQRALGDELTHEPATPRTERDAQRQLSLASRDLGEHQVGDVGAGDQQDEAGRAKQDQQRRSRAAGELLLQ